MIKSLLGLSAFEKATFKINVLLFFLLPITSLGQKNAGVAMLKSGTSSLMNSASHAGVKTVDTVPGEVFTLQATVKNGTENTSGPVLIAPITSDVSKDDILWIAFESRCIDSRRETGEAFLEAVLDRKVNGKSEWPPLLERGLSCGKEWVKTQIPFIATKNVDHKDLALLFRFGSVSQTVQLRNVQLINYHQVRAFQSLPHSVVHYEGDGEMAPWRKLAAARIEKYRKGDLKVRVTDKNGKPQSNLKIIVKLLRPVYSWGTAINSNMLLDSITKNGRKYREVLLANFNKVVFENELKSKNWQKSDHEKTLESARWLRDHKIAARGHVMVWPSWQHSAHLLLLKTILLN